MMNVFLPNRGWARLAAIVGWGVAGLLFAIWSFTMTLAAVSARSSPNLAIRMDSSNADALTAKGELLLMSAAQGKGKLSDAAEVSRRALAARALSPASLRQLAFAETDATAAGHKAKLINLSSQLSRRDFGVQVWKIEDAVARNNVPDALKAYDVALRTNRDSPTVLFPTLAAAIENPEVARQFRSYLTSSSPWLPAFFDHVVGNETHVAALARLGASIGGLPASRDNADIHDRVVEVLMRQRRPEAAKSYFVARKRNLSLLTSADLNAPSLSPNSGPLGWQIFSEASYGADVEGKGLRIFAAPGRSGIVARKLLFLQPGKYDLSMRFKSGQFAPSAFLRVQMACADAVSPSPVWVGPDVSSGNFYAAQMIVPAGCAAQNLEIVAGGGDSRGETEVELSSVHLSTVAGR